MKISTLEANRRTEVTRGKSPSRGRDGAFADSLQNATHPASATSMSGGAVFSVGSILSAQEVLDATAETSKKRLRMFGDDVLDRLEELRLDILAGVVPKERLAALARTLREKRDSTDDPRLNTIIAEVELRAEVEIAKLVRKP